MKGRRGYYSVRMAHNCLQFVSSVVAADPGITTQDIYSAVAAAMSAHPAPYTKDQINTALHEGLIHGTFYTDYGEPPRWRRSPFPSAAAAFGPTAAAEVSARVDRDALCMSLCALIPSLIASLGRAPAEDGAAIRVLIAQVARAIASTYENDDAFGAVASELRPLVSQVAGIVAALNER